MRRVKISVPATIASLGPGVDSLALALAQRATVEVSERDDEQLIVETTGEGAGSYSIGLRHPVTLALARIFQRRERAPLGITVRVDNEIPLASGLGAEVAFTVAGAIAANNLLDNVYSRDEILNIAAEITGEPDSIPAAIFGGLNLSISGEAQLIYRSLPIATLEVIVVLPELDNLIAAEKPERVTLADAIFNLGRLPLLVEALRVGDLGLAGQVIGDRLHAPFIVRQITAYDAAAEKAREAGAKAVAPAGDGPALVILAEANHEEIAAATVQAFSDAGVKARSWIVPLDTQGVVVSVAESA